MVKIALITGTTLAGENATVYQDNHQNIIVDWENSKTKAEFTDVNAFKSWVVFNPHIAKIEFLR